MNFMDSNAGEERAVCVKEAGEEKQDGREEKEKLRTDAEPMNPRGCAGRQVFK